MFVVTRLSARMHAPLYPPSTHVHIAPNNLLRATDVQAIAAGYAHSMVLKRDGSVWTTGDNDRGQLGDGTYESKNCFERVISAGMWVAVGCMTPIHRGKEARVRAQEWWSSQVCRSELARVGMHACG